MLLVLRLQMTNTLGGSGSSSASTAGNTGGNQAHTNVQPSLASKLYHLPVQGAFPSRN